MQTIPLTDAIYEAISPGHCVHAERQTGKTTALMQHIHDKHRGEAIVIVLSYNLAGIFLRHYKNEYPTDLAPEVSGFLHAEEILCGNLLPVYCDEWFRFNQREQKILMASGRVKGSVGTMVQVQKVPMGCF